MLLIKVILNANRCFLFLIYYHRVKWFDFTNDSGEIGDIWLRKYKLTDRILYILNEDIVLIILTYFYRTYKYYYTYMDNTYIVNTKIIFT